MVRILDHSLNTFIGIEKFLNSGEENELSAYIITTMKLASGNMPWRLKCALSALLSKINLYEVLQNLGRTIKNSVEQKDSQETSLPVSIHI